MSSSPLHGVRIVVTRAEHQADPLVELFESEGADLARLPLLEIVPPTDPRPLERAATEIVLFQWLVLTSSNAVDAFLPLTGGALPPGLRVAVIGERTAAALRAYDREPDLVAPVSSAEGLAEALAPRLGRQERVLLPQASDARKVLGELLAQAGAETVRVCAYEKRRPEAAVAKAARLFASGGLGWVTFTSPSTVEGLVEVLGQDWEQRRSSLRAASIGPVTSAALRKVGVGPSAEADQPADEALVAAVLQAEAQHD